MGKPQKDKDDVDLILRHVSHLFPEDLARGLLGGEVLEAARVFETQVTSRQRKLDRTLDVRVGGQRRLLHLEWQSEMPVDMAFRTYEYQVLLGLAAAGQNRSGDALVPPIESVVVLLSGREEPWPEFGSYRLSPKTMPFSGVHFRIVPIYQWTIAQLEAMESSFWTIFAPLAVDADERELKRLIGRLRRRLSYPSFEELGTAMAVLAEADRRKRGLRAVVKSMLPKELDMKSEFLEEIRDQGRAQGRTEVMARLIERRLGRGLSSAERARVTERLQQDGADRLTDTILDLSPAELAAWVAPTNGN